MQNLCECIVLQLCIFSHQQQAGSISYICNQLFIGFTRNHKWNTKFLEILKSISRKCDRMCSLSHKVDVFFNFRGACEFYITPHQFLLVFSFPTCLFAARVSWNAYKYYSGPGVLYLKSVMSASIACLMLETWSFPVVKSP